MPKARTCAITINYKGADDTAACVASLSQSTVPVSIVVVDNTPNDPDLEKALLPFLDDIKLIRAPENLGFGRGNNLGIDWALANTDCEFILIFNNDAMVKPDTIRQLEAAMNLHPEAGIVTARIVLAEDETKLWYGGGEVDWRRGGGRVPGVLGPANTPLALRARHVTFASGCAMMVRSDILRQLGGFDSRFFMYEEDLELSLRVQKDGWRIWYESAAIIKHLGQGSMRKEGEKFLGLLWADNPNLPFYVFHIIQNRLINMSMNAHGWNKVMFYLFFPLFVFKLCVRFVAKKRWDGLKAMSRAFHSFRTLS